MLLKTEIHGTRVGPLEENGVLNQTNFSNVGFIRKAYARRGSRRAARSDPITFERLFGTVAFPTALMEAHVLGGNNEKGGRIVEYPCGSTHIRRQASSLNS